MRDSALTFTTVRGSGDIPKLAFTVQEAADAIGVSKRQVWNLIAASEIESFTIGRSRLIRRQALEDFLDRMCAKPAA